MNESTSLSQSTPPPPPPLPQLPPTAPSALNATAASHTQINLVWVDNSSDEDGFYLEASSAGGAYNQIAILTAGMTQYSYTGLTASTAYSFRVRAFNANGNSTYSALAAVSTPAAPVIPPPPPPNAPSGLMLTVVSPSQIELNWTDNSNDETGFYIERSSGGSAYTQIAMLTSGASTYAATGLSASTAYSFRVRAYSANGVSAYSNISTATTLNPPPPAAPSALTLTVTSTSQINLSWTDNANDETGFYIERSSGGSAYSQIAMVNAGVTTYSATGLSASTAYNFRVRAYSANGNSAYSNVAMATTQSPPPPPPNAPSGLMLTVTSHTQIGLSWTDNSTNETGFYIERALGSTGAYMQIGMVAAGVTAFSATGLTAATAYDFRVRAYNANGNSPFSNVASATTQNAPPAMKMVFMAQGHMGRTVMSCDGGQTWINDRSNNDNARCWVNGPNYVECDHTAVSGRGIDAGGGWFFATFGWGQPGTLRRSRDGVNWQVLLNDSAGGVAYYNGRVSGIYYAWSYSTDNGATWRTVQNSPANSFEYPLVSRAGDKFIAFGRANGLGVSRDQGATWQTIPSFQQNWGGYFAEGGGTLVSVGKSGYAAYSRDGGSTWTSIRPHMANWVGLVHNGTQFVGWTSSMVYRSTDGVTWTGAALAGVNDFNGPVQYNPETRTYAAIPNHWGEYYTANQRAYRSTDGATWTALPATAFRPGHPILQMTVGPMESQYCP